MQGNRPMSGGEHTNWAKRNCMRATFGFERDIRVPSVSLSRCLDLEIVLMNFNAVFCIGLGMVWRGCARNGVQFGLSVFEQRLLELLLEYIIHRISWTVSQILSRFAPLDSARRVEHDRHPKNIEQPIFKSRATAVARTFISRSTSQIFNWEVPLDSARRVEHDGLQKNLEQPIFKSRATAVARTFISRSVTAYIIYYKRATDFIVIHRQSMVLKQKLQTSKWYCRK